MHFYTFPTAPSPRRVHQFLDYKGIELPTTVVDMRNGEHLSDSYRAINPLATVPALMTDEGVMLTEIVGICTYLEALYPERPLLGSTPLERGLVQNWINRITWGVTTAFAEVLRNRSPAFANRALPGPIDVAQIPELETRGRLRYRAGLELFDQELGERPFLCGDNVTLADSDLLVAVEIRNWIKEPLPEACVNLPGWIERTRAALGIAAD